MQYKYKELEDRVEKIIGKSAKPILCFSMWKQVDEYNELLNETIVEAPDLENLFEKGKCVFFNSEYRIEYSSRIIENPTWKDVIIEANRAAYGDHIFLENVRFNKEINRVKYFMFHFGS